MRRILDAIRSAVEKKAADYLYINPETKDGTIPSYLDLKISYFILSRLLILQRDFDL
jgi:hypothetical protein